MERLIKELPFSRYYHVGQGVDYINWSNGVYCIVGYNKYGIKKKKKYNEHVSLIVI